MITTSQKLSKSTVKDLVACSHPLIFDVGCYDGKDAREILDAIPGAEIHCFEADPRSQELFEKLQIGSGLNLVKTAIGCHDGRLNFYQSNSDTRRHYTFQNTWSASSSLKRPKNHTTLFPDVTFEKSIEVDCVRLDSWTASNVQPNRLIDFIWVDVNGSERDFVLGAKDTLERTKYLHIEFSDKELYEGECTKDQLIQELGSYELMGIYGYMGNFGNLLLRNTKHT